MSQPADFRPTRVAAVQMVSAPDVSTNLRVAAELIDQAVAQGASVVLLPEYFCLMGHHDADKVAVREPLGQGPIQDFLAHTARHHGIWLIGGTLPLECPNPGQVYNTTLVFDPQGQRVARYDKIHLFGFRRDHEAYDESTTILAGSTPCAVAMPWGRLGLSVCYDLRFPELYRAMGEPDLIVVPAAFTYTTGKAHWEILLRARAIENQCYVLASAQGGKHPNGRRTWGHSMLIDPWGDVVAVLPEGPGVVCGDLDPARQHEVRTALPALRHRLL